MSIVLSYELFDAHLCLWLPLQIRVKVEICLEPCPILQNREIPLNTHLKLFYLRSQIIHLHLCSVPLPLPPTCA